jgi:hypothetical protein
MTNGDVLAAGARPEAYSERIMFLPLLSRLRAKSFRKNFAFCPHNGSKRRDFAYGKRLATGAVAIQRMIVKKAYACS